MSIFFCVIICGFWLGSLLHLKTISSTVASLEIVPIHSLVYLYAMALVFVCIYWIIITQTRHYLGITDRCLSLKHGFAVAHKINEADWSGMEWITCTEFLL